MSQPVMNTPYVMAKNLCKSFSKKQVLDDLNIEVNPGDVVGVLGENGAGKTTLLEVMLGFSPASSGAVEVFGSDSFHLPSAAKQRVGFVPQQDELIGHLTVKDQLALIASFYKNWDKSLIDDLVAVWKLDPKERIKSLSVGQRQKISILLALGHKPDLLILDEPVASLDPMARRQFLEQIVEVASDSNRAVVFSSHIVSDIERLANKIWILKDQKLYWSGDFDELKDSFVRIHLRSKSVFPDSIVIPNSINVENSGTYMCAVVSEWSETLGAEIRRSTGATLEVEPLNLEDIFLELHR